MPRRIRTYREVADPGAEDVVAQVAAQRRRLAARLAAVGRVVVVASGKGGVGKSAVAANLAVALAAAGRRVGALDADLNGPSLGRMLGAAGPLALGPDGVEPARGAEGVAVVSMDLLLESDDAPVRWRGAEAAEGLQRGVLETGALRELLADVAWGELDALVVDAPPGTGELDRILTLVPDPAAVLLVVTPSGAARRVVARSVRAAREAGVEPVALVANMVGFACPRCGAVEPLWPGEGVEALVRATGAPVWAEIPFEPALAEATDAGRPPAAAPTSPAARALAGLAERIGGAG